MLSTKPLLPIFLKKLVIASMTLASVSVFAGHHEEAEKKIGDLKDMSSEAAEKIKAEDMTEKLDAEAVEGAMSDKAKKMMDGKADEMTDKAMELKPN